jgi:adenylosuccinate synthase
VGEKIFKLHLIPSGIIHSETVNVMGNGMAIHPGALLEEMDDLIAGDIFISPDRLVISHAAHMITPAHRALDGVKETQRGDENLGTTRKGIGPAYTDKASRHGLRMHDLLDKAVLKEKLKKHLTEAETTLSAFGDTMLDFNIICEKYLSFSDRLAPYIQDTSLLVADAIKAGKSILGEGAQGILLDIDHGTYPFVTSSPCSAASMLQGLGIGIRPVRQVIGVTKAFQSRVGTGPFPTELNDITAEQLRGTGANPWDEFGTTTGRPRRVGWLDGVLLRYAARVNGLTELAITKLDILSGLPSVKICTAYQVNGEEHADLPMGTAGLETFQPVYEVFPGWDDDLRTARKWSDLPTQAQRFIQRIIELNDLPVKWISVGPEREQVVEIET